MIDRWREVYEREYPRLLRALLAIGRDPAAAEDAAQEAFVKAHRTGLDNIEKLPAWLLVVGVREVFRKARRSRRGRGVWASLPPRNDGFATGVLSPFPPAPRPPARRWCPRSPRDPVSPLSARRAMPPPSRRRRSLRRRALPASPPRRPRSTQTAIASGCTSLVMAFRRPAHSS